MNYIDVILLLFLLLSIWNGLRKRFILGMIELMTWLGSLVLCFLCYPYIATWLDQYLSSSTGIMLLSLLLTIAGIRVFYWLVVDKWIDRIPDWYELHPLNKVFGFLPGMANGFVYAMVVNACFLLLPFGQSIKSSARESWLAQRLTDQLEAFQAFIAPVLNDITRGALTVTPKSGEIIRLGFKVSDAEIREDLEADMLLLINTERRKVNLFPLKADPDLANVARAHSQDMFSRGYFSHFTLEKKDPFDRIMAADLAFVAAGENLALAQTLALAHKSLMNSPGHRANILHKAFGRVGIGILDGGIHGLMITQNFRN